MFFDLGDLNLENIPEIAHTFIGLVTTMTKHYVPAGVPLIYNSDIKPNRFVFKKQIYLDDEFARKNNNRRHKLGDIVTVHTG
jgi:type I restriction enzyme, S subunit